MKKGLIEILNIKRNDIISITGTGGKTSLMFEIAKKLKEKGKVLITTSTKIKMPQEDEVVDYIYTSKNAYKSPKNKCVVVFGEMIKEKNKLKEIDRDFFVDIIKDFDYILIEADGSRNLPLKYWKSYEPVIYEETTKVIGVIPIKVMGKIPNSDFIYNFDDYSKNIGLSRIDKEVILKLIKSKPGFFSTYVGKKIIYINQVDRVEEIKKAKGLGAFLLENTYDMEVFYGSIFKGEYYEN